MIQLNLQNTETKYLNTDQFQIELMLCYEQIHKKKINQNVQIEILLLITMIVQNTIWYHSH